MAYFVDTDLMPANTWPASYNPQLAYFGYPGLMAPLPLDSISVKYATNEPNIKTTIDGTRWAFSAARTGSPRREWTCALTAPESVAYGIVDQFHQLFGAASSKKLGGWQFLPPFAGRNAMTWDESTLTHLDTYNGDFSMGSQGRRQVYQVFDSAAYRQRTEKTVNEYVKIAHRIPVFPGSQVKICGWWGDNPNIRLTFYNQYGNETMQTNPFVPNRDPLAGMDWRESNPYTVKQTNEVAMDVFMSLRPDYQMLEPRVVIAPFDDATILQPTDPTLRETAVRGSRALSAVISDINITPQWYPTHHNTHSVGEPIHEVTFKIIELG